MPNPIFVFADITSYSLTASGGSSSGRDVSNLKSYSIDDIWESNITGAHQSLTIDLGSIQTIDTLVIDNHNFITVLESGIIQLQTADDYGFTINSTTAIFDIFPTNSNANVFTFPSVSNRYFKIFYDGIAIEKPYIGNLFLATGLEFPRHYLYGYETNNGMSQTEEFFNLKGTIRSTQTDITRDIYALDFKMLNNTFRNNFASFVKNVKGKMKPYYFKDVNTNTKYVKFVTDYNPSKVLDYDLNDIASIKFISLLENPLSSTTTAIYDVYETDEIIL